MKKKLISGILLATGLTTVTAVEAGYVFENEPNNSFETAQNLNRFDNQFNLDISYTEYMPHTEVYTHNDGSFDYFSFNIIEPSLVIVDVYASGLDSAISLYDSDKNLIAYEGSPYTHDSSRYANQYGSEIWAYLNAGLYYAVIGGYQNESGPWGGYTLFVAADHPATVPVPAALPLMLSGLGAMGFLTRRKNNHCA